MADSTATGSNYIRKGRQVFAGGVSVDTAASNDNDVMGKAAIVTLIASEVATDLAAKTENTATTVPAASGWTEGSVDIAISATVAIGSEPTYTVWQKDATSNLREDISGSFTVSLKDDGTNYTHLVISNAVETAYDVRVSVHL